jgi:hypothetical protein
LVKLPFRQRISNAVDTVNFFCVNRRVDAQVSAKFENYKKRGGDDELSDPIAAINPLQRIRARSCGSSRRRRSRRAGSEYVDFGG